MIESGMKGVSSGDGRYRPSHAAPVSRLALLAFAVPFLLVVVADLLLLAPAARGGGRGPPPRSLLDKLETRALHCAEASGGLDRANARLARRALASRRARAALESVASRLMQPAAERQAYQALASGTVRCTTWRPQGFQRLIELGRSTAAIVPREWNGPPGGGRPGRGAPGLEGKAIGFWSGGRAPESTNRFPYGLLIAGAAVILLLAWAAWGTQDHRPVGH